MDNILEPLNLSSIDAAFPKESMREGQREAIEFATKKFNEGYKVVIIEGPTGSGKSSIGMTFANMVNTSFYLTITKILQDQLTGDFKDLIELKGRNAYPCTVWSRHGQTMIDRKLYKAEDIGKKKRAHSDCANGFCRTKKGGNKHSCELCFTKSGAYNPDQDKVTHHGYLSELKTNNTYSDCPYYEQVYQALNGRKVVMNFSSFMFQTMLAKRFADKRDLLIVDEAHNIEQELLGFVELKISDESLQKYGYFVPEFDNAIEYATWLQDMNIEKVIDDIAVDAEKKDDAKTVDYLKGLIRKIKLFIYSIEKDVEWAASYESFKGTGSVSLKPIFVNTLTEPLLFNKADRVLLLSATILDVNVLCRSLGLKREEVAAYRMKNRFPKENRPIYIETVAKMTGGKKAMDDWAPKLTEKVNEICNKYPDKKGIIHTHNFAIMDWISKNCEKGVKARFFDQRDFRHKGEMLQAHAKTSNGILVAPAMHEGIDLADDLSRFQIICKVPYANFFDDPQLGRRVELDRRYYTWMTALKIVQCYGRSVRSPTDYADTYIIDESIEKFLRDAKSMIPNWFKEAIVEK